MKLNTLLTEQTVRKYLTEMTKEELVSIMEGITSCGNFIKDAASLEDLAKAYNHRALENHATDLAACKNEIKQAIAQKLALKC